MRITDIRRLNGFRLLSADKGAAAGGGGAKSDKTDLEQLTEANARITALEGEVQTAEQKVKDIEAKVTGLTTRAETAEASVTRLEAEKTGAIARAEKAEGEVTTLKNASKTADQKAREIAAANGSNPTPKDGESTAAAANDGKALYEAYEALMKDRKFAEASAHMEKHQKAIDAYATQVFSKRD
jgi:TolA-binding protein